MHRLGGMAGDRTRQTLPVSQERLTIDRDEAKTGRVRLAKRVEHVPVDIELPLAAEELIVDRVAINRDVDAAAAPRTEGDVTIIPVYAERVVTRKALVLVEELRVRRVRGERTHRARAVRRVERIEVSRRPPNEPPDHDGGKP